MTQMQVELRQYINDLLLKTGGAAAPGFPINSCKLYPVRLQGRCITDPH